MPPCELHRLPSIEVSLSPFRVDFERGREPLHSISYQVSRPGTSPTPDRCRLLHPPVDVIIYRKFNATTKVINTRLFARWMHCVRQKLNLPRNNCSETLYPQRTFEGSGIRWIWLDGHTVSYSSREILILWVIWFNFHIRQVLAEIGPSEH